MAWLLANKEDNPPPSGQEQNDLRYKPNQESEAFEAATVR